MRDIRREIYQGSMNGLPFVLSTLHRNSHTFSIEQNWHENPEIQLFTRGEGVVILNGERHRVEKGDIVAVSTNMVHHTYSDSKLTYICIIISSEWCRAMGIDYTNLSFEPMIKSQSLTDIIQNMESIYQNTDDNLRITRLNRLLADLMIDLVENHSARIPPEVIKTKAFEAVTQTIEYVHNNYRKKIDLSEIAKNVLFDKYALCREFKKLTGQRIFEYINRYRCKKASEYLKNGCTVSNAADLCGFENLSFFTKTFKNYIGITPSEFKKRGGL